ncbi:unnamed protein product [Acanthosepion pharaonis]|uniref:Uncharacterized protein n=1 Tax=Acanthosepion pharaonis TaxID=158019 RepID=A0A812BF99_ACAPH|nr:unnamed protein product [Sepia pharaonis]
MILLIISVFPLIPLRAHYTFVVYRHTDYHYDSLSVLSIISVFDMLLFLYVHIIPLLSSSIDMQLTLMILLIISVFPLIPLHYHYTFRRLSNHFSSLSLIPLRAHYTFVVYRHAAYSPHHFHPVCDSPHHFVVSTCSSDSSTSSLCTLHVRRLSTYRDYHYDSLNHFRLSLYSLYVHITLSSSIDMQLTLMILLIIFSCLMILLIIYRFISDSSIYTFVVYRHAAYTYDSPHHFRLPLIPLRAHYTFVVYRHAAYHYDSLIISVFYSLHFRRLSTCSFTPHHFVVYFRHAAYTYDSPHHFPHLTLMILLIIYDFSLIPLRAHYTFVVCRHAAYTYDSPHHFRLVSDFSTLSSSIDITFFRRLSTCMQLRYDSPSSFPSCL